MWMSDGSPDLKLSKGFLCCGTKSIVQCTALPQDPNDDLPTTWYNAMWVDGPGANSGEHYWIIKFTDLSGPASVGFSNKARFQRGNEIRRVFYEGDLSLGNGPICSEENPDVIFDFGPPISPENHTVGLLASYTTTEAFESMDVFIYLNGRSLGSAFLVTVSELQNLYPVVRFGGKGIAQIQKESKIPIVRVRVPKSLTLQGIEGPWKLMHNTLILNSQSFALNDFITAIDTTLMLTRGEGNNFKGKLYMLGTFSFDCEKTERGWACGELRDEGGTVIDFEEGNEDEDILAYKKGVWDLLKSPQSVSFGSENEMIVINAASRVCFARIEWDVDNDCEIEAPDSYTGSID